MRFRFHKGQLNESLKTLVKVKNIKELCSAINKYYKVLDKKFLISHQDIYFQYIGYDERIGWDTFYVKDKRDGHVIGMSDADLGEIK